MSTKISLEKSASSKTGQIFLKTHRTGIKKKLKSVTNLT